MEAFEKHSSVLPWTLLMISLAVPCISTAESYTWSRFMRSIKSGMQPASLPTITSWHLKTMQLNRCASFKCSSTCHYNWNTDHGTERLLDSASFHTTHTTDISTISLTRSFRRSFPSQFCIYNVSYSYSTLWLFDRYAWSWSTVFTLY